MPEKMPEQNFYNKQKAEDGKNNLKYSLDVFSDEISAAEIDIKLSRKEVVSIFKVCCEEGYEAAISLLKNYANKSGFKKTVVSPFSVNFYQAPHHKDNSYFIPSAYIPRLNNLQKIIPDMAKSGTESIIMHEREHGRAEALMSYGDKIDEKSDGKIKGTDIESLTNLQKIKKLAEIRGGQIDKNFIVKVAAAEFAYLEILKRGTEILESENIENTAKDYFKHYYLFWGKDESLEKYQNQDKNDYLREFIKAKKENRTNEFYNLFLEEFRKIRNEVLKKYDQYIKENNIADFYGQEDRECEDLRIKIINRLNREKLI